MEWANIALRLATGKHPFDLIKHPFQIFQHLVIPEPDHLESSGLQKGGSWCIALLIVLTTIELHDEAAFEAGEVDDEWGHRVLEAKLAASALTVAELAPQHVLGKGSAAAQFPGQTDYRVFHSSSLGWLDRPDYALFWGISWFSAQ